MDPADRFDAIIVGAGACGAEAAWRLARQGRRTLLVTTSLDTIFAAEVENPSASAPAGTLKSALLPRLQAHIAADGTIGAWELHGAAKSELEALPELTVLQSSVDALIVRDGKVVGVETWEGVPRYGERTALCVGSFLRARLRRGTAEERAGRPGEMAYDALAEALTALGVPLRPTRVRAAVAPDAEPYELRFDVIDKQAVTDHHVTALAGLYAAGVCLQGPLRYPAAAAEGASLAAALLQVSSRASR